MSIMVYKVAHDFESSDLGNLVVVQCLSERGERVESCNVFGLAESTAFHLILDSSRPPSVIPCDVRGWGLDRVIETVATIIQYLGETDVARDDGS